MSTIIVPSPPIITSESGGSLELGETSTTAYRGDRGAFAYEGALDFYNDRELLKNPTGFTNNQNITVTYNSTTRKVTLTGTFEAYYRGEKVTALVDGWVSDAHPTTLDKTYFLKHNGTAFSFTDVPWTFDDLMICVVQYGTNNKIALKETHGFMQPCDHLAFHSNIGTYKTGGGSLTTGSYVLASQTVADKRPLVDTTSIQDEDLPHTINALVTKAYTQKYLTGASNTRNFTVDALDIIPLSGTVPYYNQFTGGVWTQTLIPNNNYCAVFVTAIPVTADVTSQKYRYIWVQPQTIGTLADIEPITHNDIVTGDTNSLLAEYVPILKLILYVTGNNWSIHSVTALTGNKFIQSGSPSGNYLTIVASDVTIDGDGTSANPLTVPHVALINNPHGVTKAQVGLGNVDNTSDANKPISTATATALAGKEPTITGSVVTSFWSGTKTFRDLATDVRAVILTGLSTATGTAISATDTVLSAFGKLQKQIVDNLTTLTNHTGNTSNPHSVTKTQVGLGSVDNTSDASKPVSTAQQNALNLKLDATAYTASDVLTKIKTVDGTGSGLDADLLDGYEQSMTATASTIATRNASGNLVANVFAGMKQVDNTNETTLANGHAGGTLYLNYRGATSAITDTQIGDGMGTGGKSNVTANRFNSMIATGSAPLTVVSTTKVANLNVDRLDDQEGSYYLDWTNITNKPDPVITLAGDLTGSITLTDLTSGTLTATVLDNSHNHVTLQSIDDRDFKPSINTSSTFRLVFTSLGGMTGVADSDYQDLMILNSYSDASGGKTNALTFDKSEMKIRHYQAGTTATTWGTPRELAYKDEITATAVGLGNVTNESKATMFTNPTFTGTVVLPSTTSIGTISSTELGYLDGVTSAIQTQLGGKEPSITASVVTSFWSGTKTFRDLATDVRAVVLTGLSLATSTAITATDTILVALGKLQAQFTTHTAVHAPSNAQKNSDITKAEIEAKLTGQIETHTHPASGVTALYDEDLTKYTRDVTVRNASNMPTEVQYKRYGTATLFMKRTYTNPDANAQFQTVTELFYDTNGTTLLYTVTWTLTYGVKGEIDTASRVIV